MSKNKEDKISKFKDMLMKNFAEYQKKVEGKIKPPFPLKFRIRDVETLKIVGYELIKDDGVYRQEVIEDGTITDPVKCMHYFEGAREQFVGGFDMNNIEVYQKDIVLLDEEQIKNYGAARKYCVIDIDNGGFMLGRGYDPFHMNTHLWLAVRYPDKIPSLELKAQCTVAGDIYNNNELLEEILDNDY